MLLHEVVGFTITGKVDGVSLLLHVMPKMEAAGCMSESFTADNKEDLHETFRSVNSFPYKTLYHLNHIPINGIHNSVSTNSEPVFAGISCDQRFDIHSCTRSEWIFDKSLQPGSYPFLK